MEEIWKPIKNYETLYEVSNLGNIKSYDKYIPNRHGTKTFKKSKLISSCNNGNGYLQVKLSKNGKRKAFYVHRLVCDAFLGNLDSNLEVNHIDCDKSNNKLDNLEIISHKENMIHAYNNNLLYPHFNFKINETIAKEIKKLYMIDNLKQYEICKKLQLSKSIVQGVCSGKTWKHVN